MKKLGILLFACITALNLSAQEFKIGKFRFEIETPTTVKLIGANKVITKVILSETIDYKGNSYTITSIGEWAFKGCKSLKSVTIPNSVTNIGEYAFSSCKSLKSVTIPNSVTSIGRYAFTRCESLTSMVVASGNNTYDSRDNCNAIIETATNTLIAGCQNTTIPNSVTSIGDWAFDGCSTLTSVTIPNSVTSIGWGAFNGCYSLTSVTIPNSVTSIGEWAFGNCYSLTSVTIPKSVTSIGVWAVPSHTKIIRR